MADYAAPVALGIKVPDAMSTLGSVFSAATSAQNLKGAQLDYQRKQATLPADIARAQAESSAAQSNATVQAANVGSNITQATEAAKQSQIATHSQQYKFGSEVAGKVLDIGKGLYSSDSASKAELAKTPEELNDASAGLTDDVLAARDRAYDVTGDRKKVDIQFAPLLAKAAHDPANFRKFLLPIINQGATPGTITPNGPVLDTGQQAVPMNVSPAAGPTGPIVGAGWGP